MLYTHTYINTYIHKVEKFPYWWMQSLTTIYSLLTVAKTTKNIYEIMTCAENNRTFVLCARAYVGYKLVKGISFHILQTRIT